MRPRQYQRGFTMIELLITLAVSGIALAGVLATHLVAVRTNAGAAGAADAIAIAERTIEDARSLTIDQMYTEYDDSDSALPIDHDFGLQTVAGRTQSYTRRIVVEDAGTTGGLIRIRVEVTWIEEAEHRVAFEIVRTKQEHL
jgi:prepilin-type N-terminal cleavage/methylation domain-containing protein